MYRPIYLDNKNQADVTKVMYNGYQVYSKEFNFSWKRGEPP